MRPDTHARDITSSGELVRGTFGISAADEVHIMGILRDGLYTDKILAVLREYSSNAWDAHREVGKHDLPIKVQLPTELDPTLVIRDWGPGLSEHNVFNVYTKYGASTKRNTDDAVGMLGIGCKAGFAYSDSFTVTSWHGGSKKIYLAVLDASDRGEMNKLHEEPCGDETGVEISISVRPQDVSAFHEKAKSLFTYFDPRPDINTNLPPKDHTLQKSGYITDNNQHWNHQWFALMGCVPYRIDPNKLRDELIEVGASDAMNRLSGAVFFNIGEVRISANREELKYTDKTRARIAERVRELLDEYIETAIVALKDSSSSDWEKRVQTAFMVNNLRIEVPTKFRAWATETVSLWGRNHPLKPDPPLTFTLHKDGTATTEIPVREYHSLVIKDDPRRLSHFSYPAWKSTLVRPVNGFPVEDVRKELEEYLEASNMTGIEIAVLSTFHYTAPAPSERKKNIKHRVKTFRMKTAHSAWAMTSDDWTVEEREPTDDDVWVTINRFKVTGYDDFARDWVADSKLAAWMGVEMPPVYGYKSTPKSPVDKSKIKGMHYREWRTKFFHEKLSPYYKSEANRLDRIERMASQGWEVDKRNYWETKVTGLQLHERLLKELGPKHPLTRMFTLLVTADECTKHLTRDVRENLAHWRKIVPRPKGRRTPTKKALDDFYARYPLFQHSQGLRVLGGEQVSAWLEYIKLIDRDKGRTP